MFRTLALCWSIHMVIGILLINIPRRKDLKNLKMSLLNQDVDPDQGNPSISVAKLLCIVKREIHKSSFR